MKHNWSQDIYIKAWNFASEAHGNQKCPSVIEGQKIPYINHIGSVAMELIFALNSDSSLNGNLAIQCALLHDTIEDTAIDFETLKDTFGLDVAQGVLALTKDKKLPTKREQMLDSLHRIKLQPKEIWLVKLADRITNLSPSPCHWNKEKRQAYREEALLIYEYLHEANALLATRLKARAEAYKKYIEI